MSDGDRGEDLCDSARPNRRIFIGSTGALGLSSAVAALEQREALAQDKKPSVGIPRPASVGRVNVLRKEIVDIPGGKESFLEWLATDENGLTRKFLVHHTRIDANVTYNMSTNITVHTYGSGDSERTTPLRTKRQSVTVNGIKGEVQGQLRNDLVTITTVHDDGSTSQQSLTSAVRLDVQGFDAQDVTELVQSIGKQILGR